jgi:hypothetical protein
MVSQGFSVALALTHKGMELSWRRNTNLESVSGVHSMACWSSTVGTVSLRTGGVRQRGVEREDERKVRRGHGKVG